MKSYLCYIYRAHKSVADFTVVTCDREEDLPAYVDNLTHDWPGWTRIEAFDGDHSVYALDAEVKPPVAD